MISADETPVRAGPGPKARKRYLLAACTNLLTYYFLGDLLPGRPVDEDLRRVRAPGHGRERGGA